MPDLVYASRPGRSFVLIEAMHKNLYLARLPCSRAAGFKCYQSEVVSPAPSKGVQLTKWERRVGEQFPSGRGASWPLEGLRDFLLFCRFRLSFFYPLWKNDELGKKDENRGNIRAFFKD